MRWLANPTVNQITKNQIHNEATVNLVEFSYENKFNRLSWGRTSHTIRGGFLLNDLLSDDYELKIASSIIWN